eukprot:15462675-Alexandrium_andersonii.AAC.1
MRQCPSGSHQRHGGVGPSDAPAAGSGDAAGSAWRGAKARMGPLARERQEACLLYTSDAADDM